MNDISNWLVRLRRGENAAYELLISKFESPLYRFFYSDHRNHQLAEDQSAETFVQLVRSLPSMKGNEEQLSSFVFSVARNVKYRRYRNSKERLQSLEDIDCIDSTPTPAERVELNEDLSQLLDAIENLEPMVRDVILLRYVEGQHVAVIAQALRMPEGTVKSHIHRGTQRLRELLANWNCK